MNVLEALPGLQIDSPMAIPTALNFRPPCWPPPDDYPVVIDAFGAVTSRYGDKTWNLAPWAGKPVRFNFVGGRSGDVEITLPNAARLREIAGWWLWGPDAVQNAITLRSKLGLIKPLLIVCSEVGIRADELWRFPRVIEQVAKRLHPSSSGTTLCLLNRLWLAREALGFTLLDEEGLRRLAAHLPDHEVEQTAYIPPRIWTYQLLRLRECLDDYLAHKGQVEACYRFCLQAYAHNAGGSLAAAMTKKSLSTSHPFCESHLRSGRGRRSGRKYYGAFADTAARYGIDGLLSRWASMDSKVTLANFSSYLNLVTLTGLAFCLNYSLMRADEGAQLRSDCLSIERDELGYDIHLLGGVTTKTIQDGDARWIVSPSVAGAIAAMTHVARLRMECAQHIPAFRLTRSQIDNPLLLSRVVEPWGQKKNCSGVRKHLGSYAELIRTRSKLFNLEQLRITEADHEVAHQMTFGLDPERFAVGQIWPLAWHQLRRTGAVNMQASGLVSEASLQYQLKHLSRGMTRYYGQNWYKLKARLDDEAAGYYLKEKFRMLAREFAALRAREMVSPYGEKRKAQILQVASDKDHEGLVKAAEMGKVSYVRTIYGACTNPVGPCAYGGIANFAFCTGFGDKRPCEHALLDTKQEVRDRVRKLQRSVKVRLLDVQQGSPLADSLKASIEATQRYLDVADAV